MDEYPDDPNTRDCVVRRGTKGFGFNIKGTTQLGGTMMAIGGVLYPPLQYVSAVDENGAAYQGGVRLWDRILEVNGNSVMGANHQKVVEYVLKGGDNLNLKVVRVTDDEAERLRLIEEGADPNNKKKNAKILVDGWEERTEGGKEFTVYHIRGTDSQIVSSHRFSEFVALHKKLMARFRIFRDSLPQLPSKKLNGLTKSKLSKKETEVRCEKLNTYIQELLAIEEVANSQLMKDFIPDPAEKSDTSKAAEEEEATEEKEEEDKSEDNDDNDEDEEVEKSKETNKAAPLFSDINLDDNDD